jgi:dolichyl-phosphate-mannose--protein O-mannosyl transferase
MLTGILAVNHITPPASNASWLPFIVLKLHCYMLVSITQWIFNCRGHSALIDLLVVKRMGQITVVGCVRLLDCNHRQVFGRYSN